MDSRAIMAPFGRASLFDGQGSLCPRKRDEEESLQKGEMEVGVHRACAQDRQTARLWILPHQLGRKAAFKHCLILLLLFTTKQVHWTCPAYADMGTAGAGPHLASSHRWHVEAEGKLYRPPGKFNIQVHSGVDWFELHGAVEFGDTAAPLPELLAALRRDGNIVKLGDGTFGLLPEDGLQVDSGRRAQSRRRDSQAAGSRPAPVPAPAHQGAGRQGSATDLRLPIGDELVSSDPLFKGAP